MKKDVIKSLIAIKQSEIPFDVIERDVKLPVGCKKIVTMFFDEIQLIKDWEYFVLRVYKSYCKNITKDEEEIVMVEDKRIDIVPAWKWLLF